MVERPNAVTGTAIATHPAQQFVMTSDQIRDLLVAVRDFGVAEFANLHKLSDSQKRANALFESAATGLAVTGFGTPAPLLERKDGNISVDVPKNATRAVVYEQSGVRRIDNIRPPTLVVSNDAKNRVGRIEFFDGNGVLLAITGGEPPPPTPSPRPPSYSPAASTA